jgi:hypothetical protein
MNPLRGWTRTVATQRSSAVRAGLAAAFLSYVVAVYGICYLAPGYGLFDDDGVYLVTAKSLAEGTGYRIVSLPNAIPQTKYPRSSRDGFSVLSFLSGTNNHAIWVGVVTLRRAF